MDCDIQFGRLLSCKDGVGGITGLDFFNFGTITPVFGDVENPEVITDLGTATAYHYDIRSASNLIQTMNSNSDAGTTTVDQIITAILQRMDFKTNRELKIMAYGHPHVVVQFKDGQSWMVGLEFGASLETSIADSGTAMADLQGYTLNIVGAELTYANYLVGSVIGNPFAAMTGVTVVNGTDCSSPTGVIVTNTSVGTGVDFSYTANVGDIAWEYALIAIGDNLDISADFVLATASPVTGVTNTTTGGVGVPIVDGSQYKVYVRAACGAGTFSNPSVVENFQATA